MVRRRYAILIIREIASEEKTIYLTIPMQCVDSLAVGRCNLISDTHIYKTENGLGLTP